MFICRSTNRVPEVREIREERAWQLDEGETFREGRRAVQAGLAREGMAIEIIDA